MPTAKTPFCCVDDYEKYALSVLPKYIADFYKSGAEQEYTLRNNREAFYRLRIRPRVLVDVSSVSTATTVLSSPVSLPLGVAPSGMQMLAHPAGECANAKAAGQMGCVYTLSTVSTYSIEEVSAAAPSVTKWFQLYIYKDRDVTRTMVERAENNGYRAVVLTVDMPVVGIRYNEERNRFALPPHLKLANFTGKKSSLNEGSGNESNLSVYANGLFDDGLTWNDIKWLKSITRLPIVLKGILTAEDALKAVDAGVAAIQVSNHGARQLDSAPATIEALPEVIRAVGDRCEVYFDGGVRNGSDIFKAIALGAKMVFIGRPALWGLTHDGQRGVESVLNILKRELKTAMCLSGCRSIAEIANNPDLVVHETFYSRL